jgi:hypothetical protein
MKLNIKNETGRLKSVVLGQPNSMGAVPTLEESYDANHIIQSKIIFIRKKRISFMK